MSLVLQPLSSDVTRVVRGTSVTLVKANGEASPSVDLLDLLQLPILVIGMDQGSSGCAAAAYLSDCGKTAPMCHFYWDGFHRLIRDLTLAQSGCSSTTKRHLQQGQLCGGYMYSINYKPFAKSGFHDDKRALLEAFMQTENKDQKDFKLTAT